MKTSWNSFSITISPEQMTNENINTIHGLDKPVHHYISVEHWAMVAVCMSRDEGGGTVAVYNWTVILCCLAGEIIQPSLSMYDNNVT